MKRTIILFLVIITTGLLLLAWFLPSPIQNQPPRFVPVPAGFKILPHKQITYNFLLPSPFEGGLAWIGTAALNKTGWHWYLYDIEQRKVLGELLNGWPIFGNRDGSKVLLTGDSVSFKQRLLQFLDHVTGGLFKLTSRIREESFVVLDTKENRAERVGNLHQSQGSGSRWYPSPTFRYGFTSPTVNSGGDVFVCDLEKQQMTKKKIRGTTVGWWDETKILYKSKEQDFALYDIVNDGTSILLKADKIKEFLKENELSTDLSQRDVKPFPMWDGQQYQFYFANTYDRWLATNSFLTKIERPSGKLKLIDANFKFEWSDIFDPTGRYYIYSGREVKEDKVGAVFLRDLQTGTTRTLVEDSGENQFSIPQWYGDGVIYSRSNMLWRIALSETNSTRVFPPPDE